ncbi:MAG TPA: class I SAM-dependent methyltransferase [Parafilimonas sp.]|nr:class I SAM-dependent methyltransferase [Parafilimonas sp.]
MAATEWFRLWFNSPYYHLLYKNRNEAEAIACINSFTEYLKIPEGSFILDAACGKGRHSRAFAAKGFNVTGIDLSPDSIIEAKRYEQENLHFYVHDLRLPFWINYFNYAFNFFTSFGYFKTMREHNDAIRTITQSLKLNGVFVIDYLNVRYVEDNFVAHEEKKMGSVFFKISRWFNDDKFYKRIQVEDEEKNLSETYTEEVKKFTLGDFTDMLSYGGLLIENAFGDYTFEKYDVKKSPRMIIVAKKINY